MKRTFVSNWLTAWKILYGCLLASWLGGLTFYSIVVIPLGTARWGSVEQGMLTAAVTVRLNALATIAILVIMIDSLRRRCRRSILGALLLVVTQLLIYFLHVQLSGRIDDGTGEILQPEGQMSFYTVHRVYLLVTAAQWLLGVLFLAGFSSRVADSSPSAS